MAASWSSASRRSRLLNSRSFIRCSPSRSSCAGTHATASDLLIDGEITLLDHREGRGGSRRLNAMSAMPGVARAGVAGERSRAVLGVHAEPVAADEHRMLSHHRPAMTDLPVATDAEDFDRGSDQAPRH